MVGVVADFPQIFHSMKRDTHVEQEFHSRSPNCARSGIIVISKHCRIEQALLDIFPFKIGIIRQNFVHIHAASQ